MKESQIEKYLVKRVKALKGECRKIRWLDRNGAPDRLVMLPGKPVFTDLRGRPMGEYVTQIFLVELKAPNKDATAAQKREHKRLQKFGWRVEVVNSMEQVDEVLG